MKNYSFLKIDELLGTQKSRELYMYKDSKIADFRQSQNLIEFELRNKLTSFNRYRQYISNELGLNVVD